MPLVPRLQLLLVLPAIALGQGKAASTHACEGSWSSPFPVQRANGRPVYVERGIVAPLGDRTLALGTPTFFWMRLDSLAPAKAEVMDTADIRWSFTRSGALIDASGTADGVPRLDSARLHWQPALLGSQGRTVSVIWQVGDSNATPNGDFPPVTHIDLASFDGRQWSVPETIIRGRIARVGPLPAARPGSTLDVVAAVATDSTGAVIRLARRNSGKWSTVDWHGGWFLQHAEALPAVDGSTDLVVSGSVKDATAVYSVRAQWTRDSVVWSQPIILDSIHVSYTDFSSARLGGDSIIVVRSRSTREGGDRGGTMLTTLSTDGGRNWQQLAPLVVGTDMTPRLVVDAEGRLHVLFRGANRPDFLNSPGAIMHSMWQSGTWTTPVAVSRNDSVVEPGAGVAPGGRVMVIWAEGRLSAAGMEPKTFASLWTGGCARK